MLYECITLALVIKMHFCFPCLSLVDRWFIPTWYTARILEFFALRLDVLSLYVGLYVTDNLILWAQVQLAEIIKKEKN